MKNLKIAIVQHKNLTTDIGKNTLNAMAFIKEAKANGADFVLFPECFLTTYYCPKICKELKPVNEIENHSEFVTWRESAIEDNDKNLKEICNLAKEESIGVCITAFTKGIKYPQNSAYIIDRNGDIILKYSKVHTCDFDWERYLEGGEAFNVCNFDGITIGVMICYDREHPESARELMLQGAELIFVPNDCDAMYPRLQELSVAAMQNMVGVAMANPPSEEGGNSCAYSPIVWNNEGKSIDNAIIVAEKDYDGIVYADFDIEKLRKYRNSEFLGKNRKPKAYKHLV